MNDRITIAEKPTANTNPWISARTAYDNSLEYHLGRSFTQNNPLPAGSDLDQMTNPEEQGATYILTSAQPANMPFTLYQTTLLEITGGPANTTTQRLIDARGISWRKRHPSATGVTSWGEWHLAPGHRIEPVSSSRNLNTLHSSEWEGSWWLSAVNPPSNLPFTLYQSSILDIEHIGNTQYIQRVTDAHMSAWRKTHPSAGSTALWGPWHIDYTTVHPSLRAVEMDESYNVLNGIGDIHARTQNGIASVTKVLAALVAEDIIQEHSLGVTSLRTVQWADDMPIGLSYSGPLLNGDRISLINLLRLSLMASDNMAPMTIARVLGTSLSGSGTPFDKFVRAMNEKLVEVGAHGAMAYEPTSRARLSPYDTARMMTYMHNNATKYARTIGYMGDNSSNVTWQRSDGSSSGTQTINNVLMQSFTYVPEVDWGKGGNHFGRQHIAAKWTNARGQNRIMVLQDVPTGIRVSELRKLIVMSNLEHYPNSQGASGGSELPELAKMTDLNNLTHDAEYIIPALPQTNYDIQNLPSNSSSRGLLKVISWSRSVSNDSVLTHQEIRYPGQLWVRSTSNSSSWNSEWQRIF